MPRTTTRKPAAAVSEPPSIAETVATLPPLEPHHKPRTTATGKAYGVSQEQAASIPILYARCGNKREVARQLGIDESTVRRWLDKQTPEEWDRIYEMQVAEIVKGSVEIVMACVGKIGDPTAIKDMSVHQAIGAYKIFSGEIRSWKPGKAANAGGADELTALLAEAEMKRRQAAIDEALATGSLEPLKAFATT